MCKLACRILLVSNSSSLLPAENDENTKLAVGQSLCRHDMNYITIADRSEVLLFMGEETGWLRPPSHLSMFLCRLKHKKDGKVHSPFSRQEKPCA